jgi:hypothetical protein
MAENVNLKVPTSVNPNFPSPILLWIYISCQQKGINSTTVKKIGNRRWAEELEKEMAELSQGK